MPNSNTATIKLLSTKWSSPQLPPGQIQRQHLFRVFDLARDQPLTLVSAPAGYGKTSVVAAWLYERKLPFAWLSLDEHDSTLAQTFAYLVATIRASCPGSCESSWSAARASQHLQSSQMADLFLEDLEELTGSLVLVLDDFHSLADQETIRFMRRVISQLPQTIRMIIVSRTDPPLRLSQLRGRGLLTEIRAADLRFTNQESAALLAQETEDSISEDLATNLNERIEGWVAGLQMLVINLRASRDPAELANRISAGGHQSAQDFLWSEVLQGLPVPLREQLLQISPFSRFSSNLCDHVLARPSEIMGREFIDTLIEKNLFVVPLDQEGRWYRFHHLFRLLLDSRLRAIESAESVSARFLKGSMWFEEQGEIPEAIIYALNAGDEKRAVGLIRNHCHNAFNRGDWLQVKQWLSLLPESARSLPSALVTHAILQQLEFRVESIPPLLEEARRKLESEHPSLDDLQEHELSVAYLQCVSFLGAMDPAERNVAARFAIVNLPANAHYLRGLAEAYLSMGMVMVGQTEATISYLYETLNQETSLHPSRIMRLYLGLASVHYMSGHAESLQDLAADSLALAQQFEDVVCIAWFSYALGWALYETNQLAAAESHLERVIELRYTAHRRAVSGAYGCLAMVRMASGNEQGALEAVDGFRQFLLESGLHTLTPLAQSLHRRLVPGVGNVPHELSLDPAAQIFRDGWDAPVFTVIRHLIRQGSSHDLVRAGELLNICKTAAGNWHFQRIVVLLSVLDAWLASACGNIDAALATLKLAIDQGRAGGMLRVYYDQGWDPTPLLLRLCEDNPADIYLERILAAGHGQLVKEVTSPDVKQNILTASPPDIDLTNRETDVLLLLERRLTNKEIASSLNISPLTVKKHTINLFQKMNVANRRQAVILARELGLLPRFPSS